MSGPLAALVPASAGILLSPAMGAVLLSLSTVVVAIHARLPRIKVLIEGMPMKRVALAVLILLCAVVVSAGDAPDVKLLRLPEGGVQPQVVVDETGIVHAVYLKGDPRSADVFYIRSSDYGKSFSENHCA